METCTECHREALAQNIPPLQMVIHPVDCPIHGHPAALPPALAFWIQFYNVIAPYQPNQGQLAWELMSKLCDEYHVSFTKAFEILTFMLGVIEHANQGSERSWAKDEETSGQPAWGKAL